MWPTPIDRRPSIAVVPHTEFVVRWRMRIVIAGLVLFALVCGAQAQAPGWCLKWNDGCRTCERKSLSEEPQCSQASGGCIARAIRCERADKDALRQSCETIRYADSCNACSVNKVTGHRTCTMKGCGPGQHWIVCERARR
jgi:hypothetical protein